MHPVLLSHRVIGRVQHREELHDFRRLQVQWSKRQPAPRTVDHLAQTRDQDGHEHHQTQNEHEGCPVLPLLHRYGEHQKACDTPQYEGKEVTGQVVGRAEIGETRRIRQGDRSRIHHDQSIGEQGDANQKESNVNLARIGRTAPGSGSANRRHQSGQGQAIQHG